MASEDPAIDSGLKAAFIYAVCCTIYVRRCVNSYYCVVHYIKAEAGTLRTVILSLKHRRRDDRAWFSCRVRNDDVMTGVAAMALMASCTRSV